MHRANRAIHGPVAPDPPSHQYASPDAIAADAGRRHARSTVNVRLATLDDAPAIRAIYNVEVNEPHEHVRPRPADPRPAADLARRALRCVLRRRRHAATTTRRQVVGFAVAVALQGAGGVPHHGGELGLRVARARRAGDRHDADASRDRRRPRVRVPRHRRPDRGIERRASRRCTRRSGSNSSASNARSAASSTGGSTSPSCS